MEEGTHLDGGFVLQQTDLNLEACFPQDVAATAPHVGVWIGVGDDHALNAGPKQGFRARGRSTKVIARLEGHVCGGAVCGHPSVFGVMDGHLFGVKSPEMVVPTFGNGHSVFDQHTSHRWVGTDATLPAFGDLEGASHELRLPFGPHGDV